MGLQDKKLYGTATVGTKGQIVIPADAREELGIQPGDRLYVINAVHGAGIMLLKEEMLQSFIDRMSAQIDEFRTFADEGGDK